MRYVKKDVASEDTIQLFDASGASVDGVLFSEVVVTIRKEGSSGFVSKTITNANWVNRSATTSGNYAIIFSLGDFDTLGIFRYRVSPVTPGHFVPIEDSVVVVDSLPSVFSDPPTIDPQSATLPGVSPDPVEQGATLTIRGSDLAGATDLRIKKTATETGTPLTILTNTDGEITATVPASTPLGENQILIIETPGGQDDARVSVVLNAASIPGSGLCAITGTIRNAKGEPQSGVGVVGRMLDMPNLVDGFLWTDDIISVTTDANGSFSISLPRKRRVEIMIRVGRYRREFIVPDLATADLFTQIPDF